MVSDKNNIAFIGDSSHAMLGNFGAGAGFALEDVYTLAKALDWAWSRKRQLSHALQLFDSIRSPHYERLYKALDLNDAIKASVRSKHLDTDKDIEERVKRISDASESWMYYYRIEEAVNDALCRADTGIEIARAGDVSHQTKPAMDTRQTAQRHGGRIPPALTTSDIASQRNLQCVQ
jgi:salicylate hydroxylase